MQKTILITGGAGYIGSHAVVAFEEAGYKTVTIDNFSNSDRTNLEGIACILGYAPDFYECDIADREALEKIFSQYSFDGVVHFAGLKAVGESCQQPLEYHTNNLGGTLVLAEVMRRFGVKKILFSSSATVYSAENIPPFTEEMPTGTTNPYGTTKLLIEKLLEDLALFSCWSVTSLRYFNPLGAHISGEIGEKPRDTPNNLFPYILDVAMGKREIVQVFGGDYATPDGTGVRDYIDVNDLVEAHLIAYEHLASGYTVYNIGTGKGTSVLELIRLVEEVSGKKIPYRVTDRRPGDLGEVFASAEKIEHALGWKAKRTLREAVESGWNFIQKR